MGTLSDRQIKEQMKNAYLVRNGDESQAAGACYELRLGNVYYDLTENNQRISVPKGGTVLIKPRHRVVLITHEELNLPNDTFARIISKGSLFSVGLSHVATYADPGFSGNLGIVTENTSERYIELLPLEPIAKADFTKLSEPADSTYVGQHGFKTEIWPIKTQLQKSFAEVADDERVNSEEAEANLILPSSTATTLRNIRKRQRWMDYTIAAALFLNALCISLVNFDFFSAIGGLLVTAGVGIYVGISKWYLDRGEGI